MANRRFLVMARVGDKSLHGKWIEGGIRNFDLYLSYYGSTPGKYAQDADFFREARGLKYPILYKHLEEERDLIAKYDAVWFPDDDLLIDVDSINRMFDLFCVFNLALAQPALTLNSYFSHSAVLQNKGYILRFTNFVEVMAPVFSPQALKLLSPTFSQVTVGWGLDLLWPHLLREEDASLTMAIIDDNPMVHTRPVGGGDIYKQNLNAGREDMEKLSRLYPEAEIDSGKHHAKFCIYAGIKKENYGTGFKANFRGLIHRRIAKLVARFTVKYKV